MSSFLDELAVFIEGQVDAIEFSNAAGRNMFVGNLPSDPDDLAALLGLPGTNIMSQRDIKDLHFPRFQLITRATDYETAAALFESIRSAVHGIINQDLTTWHIMRCHVEQEGGPIGQDDKGRFEFAVNIMAEYYSIPVAP